MHIDGKKFLRSEYPTKTRNQFVPAIRRAYALVKEIQQQNDFLNWKVGFDFIPHLRNVAVEFEFKRLIDKGVLDLGYRIATNHSKNCHHIEIITDNCVMTVSHVQNKIAAPRKAIYRSNLSFNNQMSIFDLLGFENDTYDIGKNYSILTHGGLDANKMPKYINLGLPNSEIKQWFELIDLTIEPQVLVIPEEVITEDEIVLEFKEHIERQGVLL
jgi:hypothetical protein